MEAFGQMTAAVKSEPRPSATADEVLAMMFEAPGIFKTPFLDYVTAAGLKPPILGPMTPERLNSLRRIMELYACE